MERTKRAATWVALLALIAACAPGQDEPAIGWVEFPEEPQPRALHCRALLSVTLQHMEELAGVGPRGGFITGRPNTELVRAAHTNSADALDGASLSRWTRERARLQADILQAFDRDGNDRLASRDELAEFNRHVERCVAAYR